jgi:hypothetical protein
MPIGGLVDFGLRCGMTNAWSGPPGRAGWYAQQNPDGTTTDAGQEERAAREEWAETHPNALQRLLMRLRRS